MGRASFRQPKGARWKLSLGLLSSVSPLVPGVAFAQSAAQTATQSAMPAATSAAILISAITFCGAAALIFLRQKRKGQGDHADASAEISSLRANLDQFESLLATLPEINIIWNHQQDPQILGEISQVCGPRKSERDVLQFGNWLDAKDAVALEQKLELLYRNGDRFTLNLRTQDNRQIEALGRPAGAGIALCLREVDRSAKQSLAAQTLQNIAAAPEAEEVGSGDLLASVASSQSSDETVAAILGAMKRPAWARNADGELTFVNQAYLQLATEMGLPNTDPDDLPEIFSTRLLMDHLGQLNAAGGLFRLENPLPDYPDFELTLFDLKGGTAGFLGGKNVGLPDEASSMTHRVPGVIEAMTAPVVVFSANAEVLHFNDAYAKLWDLDPAWLKSGIGEKDILDRLRSNNMLPSQADYQKWKREHLTHYGLKSPQEVTWYLPGGRTINFVVAPADDNGLIYVFEDVTEKLRLETEKKELVNVQRETLNALSEGVAVFSTDGRLRLHNPRLSALWGMPLNKLGTRPHINEIAAEIEKVFPEDGKQIWADLKNAVINLSPQRDDAKGRIHRSDGRLIDYAAIHLPDGETMLTFVDTTQATNYELMLKERNEALEVADRLKDAFVQSVSYELRSPLTNIIGFADLLASDTFGPLNEKQRQYTEFIRTSSTTLGVLIDNILDLTHVDAGVATLNVEPHHISELVKKARAGLAGASIDINEQQPINLSVDLPDDLPVITVDAQRVVQILYNLLSNAFRYSEPGSHVALSAEQRGDFVRLIIEDEGVGVPEELRSVLFRQSDRQRHEGRQRGVGLGLTIAQAFIELHGGRLQFEEREPRGTRAIVSLPIVTQVQASVPAAPESRS